MSSNLQNSIWPNEGGTLGQIKVQIPDGVTTTWPTGDALINNFVYHKGKLVGFVDTKALIANSSKSTTFPYEYVNISLPSIAEGEMSYNYDQCVYFILNGEVLKGDIPTDGELVIITKKYAGCKTVADVKAVDPDYKNTDIIDGVWEEGLGDLENGGNGIWDGGMFYYCINLESFSSDLSSLTDGHGMFHSCYNLESFSSALPSLTNGYEMFDGTNLTYFDIDLPNLTNGYMMFQGCKNLESFSSALPKLTDGFEMFKYCNALASFSSALPSLTDGDSMFNGCPLTSFTSDLPSLTNGKGMFNGCHFTSFSSDLSSLTNGSWMFAWANLTTFSSDLPSLTNGEYMFDGCKLDTASVEHIAYNINTVSGGTIHIGIGNSSPSSEEITAFNKIVDRGWTVYVNGSQYSKKPAPPVYTDENGEETVTPIPFWAKPVPSDEEDAQYVDEQGNFYNILGAQFIYGDNLETYGMFTCEEDAAANMRLTKIEK